MTALKPILIVEDDPRDAELMTIALREQGLANQLTVARDGVEALDFLYCRGIFAGRDPVPPVLILLDIKMPRLDGMGVLKVIKNDRTTSHIPVVLLTSSGQTQDIDKGYEMGVNAYVVKPLALDEFIQAVKSIGMFWGVLNEVSHNAARPENK